MTEYGYSLSSEEHRPADLVRYARRAEESGFGFCSLSDHFHPWVDAQGHSPFAWTVAGGVASTTSRIALGTGVTCPTVRYHPAIVAQAAATAADMMPGRFFLGVGTGENLNEHITGEPWPDIDVRQAWLEEAVEIIRLLWQGGYQTHHGEYFTIDNARLYTLPERLPPIIVAAAGTSSAELAARIGDGLWSTSPSREVVDAFRSAGGSGPIYGQVTVCWAPDEAAARKVAHEVWPNPAMPGQLSQELAIPQLFESVAELVTEDMVAEKVVCGPDPEPYVEMIRTYEEAGFTHIHLHQVGDDQDGFFRFWDAELKPRLAR